MTSQQSQESTQKLESRVANLEKELAQIKLILDKSLKKKEPWWLKVALDSFENDVTFDEAVRLGQE